MILVYYHGGEVVDANHEFYLTSQKESEEVVNRWLENLTALETHCISSRLLGEFVDNTQGAHVMFLDVARRLGTGRDQRIPNPVASPRGALFRMAVIQRSDSTMDSTSLLDALTQTLPQGMRLECLVVD